MDFGPHLILAILEGAVTAAVLALTAMGLSIVFGVMRVVNVAHGEFYMLGAVIAWWVATVVGAHPALGFVAALVIAPLVVGAMAAAADRLILHRIDYDPERTIVATIGLLYIIQQGTLMTFGPDARRSSRLSTVASPCLGRNGPTGPSPGPIPGALAPPPTSCSSSPPLPRS